MRRRREHAIERRHGDRTGPGAGLGAVAFRYLIYFVTWLATGHSQFGQAGRTGSSHLPWLGVGFLVVIPALGGLLYGPLIYRWAREARGHGVPEVMIAVADNGGRIRPQVSVVKALASALATVNLPSGLHAGRIPSFGFALVDLALYLVVFLCLGAWRAQRDT